MLSLKANLFSVQWHARETHSEARTTVQRTQTSKMSRRERALDAGSRIDHTTRLVGIALFHVEEN